MEFILPMSSQEAKDHRAKRPGFIVLDLLSRIESFHLV